MSKPSAEVVERVKKGAAEAVRKFWEDETARIMGWPTVPKPKPAAVDIGNLHIAAACRGTHRITGC